MSLPISRAVGHRRDAHRSILSSILSFASNRKFRVCWRGPLTVRGVYSPSNTPFLTAIRQIDLVSLNRGCMFIRFGYVSSADPVGDLGRLCTIHVSASIVTCGLVIVKIRVGCGNWCSDDRGGRKTSSSIALEQTVSLSWNALIITIDD